MLTHAKCICFICCLNLFAEIANLFRRRVRRQNSVLTVCLHRLHVSPVTCGCKSLMTMQLNRESKSNNFRPN